MMKSLEEIRNHCAYLRADFYIGLGLFIQPDWDADRIGVYFYSPKDEQKGSRNNCWPTFISDYPLTNKDMVKVLCRYISRIMEMNIVEVKIENDSFKNAEEVIKEVIDQIKIILEKKNEEV